MKEVIRKENNEYAVSTCNKAITLNKKDEMVYFTFPMIEKINCVNHLFTTRLGGVSKGIFASMNLSYTRGDEKEAVDENYKRVAEAMEWKIDYFVCSDQTHTTNIRKVTMQDAGKGVIKDKDYTDVDGMITNTPGIVLSTFYADCVPLYFVDPVKKAIGLSHSGWRGTVGKIGLKTIEAMTREFGTKPEDVYAAIGPSICQDCYEVSEDVANQFIDTFGVGNKDKLLYAGKEKEKYQLNLWMANYLIFIEAGICPEKISVTDVCTCCNPELLFSHRASKGRRGNLGAFLSIN